MTKKIIIIGGGISGLTLLHYLNKKYKGVEGASILLLEKNPSCGGTINSIHDANCLFETGPNGFLATKPSTLEFLNEIGLKGSVINADQAAKLRYILYQDQLHQLPSSFKSFLKFKPLNIFQKLNVFKGLFKKTDIDENISIFDFGKLKFGEKFAQLFLDSFVKGVYGADAKNISLKAAFPKLYEMDKAHGSLFKAMKALKKEKKKTGGKSKAFGAQLMSLKMGMGEVIGRLYELYRTQVSCDIDVLGIERQGNIYSVKAGDQTLTADELYICTPAYTTAKLIKDLDEALSNALTKIEYSSIGVVGFLFRKKDEYQLPDGFGYLIPSINQKKVLGILVESNIFEGRCREGDVFMRAMVGMPKGRSDLKKENESLAFEEVKLRFKIDDEPVKVHYKEWANAIPEYNLDYLGIKREIDLHLKEHSNLHLCSNYLNGISFNDCILSAKVLAEGSSDDV